MQPVSLVSCAGPDNDDVPEALAALGARLPLMEIAVQASASRAGTREYPSLDWSFEFARAVGDAGCAAALHVNGRWCREMLAGSVPPEISALLEVPTRDGGWAFGRVQLNFSCARDGVTDRAVRSILKILSPRRVVLQYNADNEALVRRLAEETLSFDVLFDESLGLGVTPALWPEPLAKRFCAYAGGFSPENARARLDEIGSMQERAFGLDAQSGVRSLPSRRTFDPRRAESLVAVAAQWNKDQAEAAVRRRHQGR